MKLTKEQWSKLAALFHQRFDYWVPTAGPGMEEPTASFTTFMQIVDEFLSSQVFLDNSKPDETPDQYIDRLIKEASPAWEGVDPEKFMDEVRGRNAGLEWKKGAPDSSGAYLLSTAEWRWSFYPNYDPDSGEWDHDVVLWHIGPIPPVPSKSS